MHGTIARPVWFPDWSGDVAAIVAGGPSVTQQDVDKLRGRCRVVVINNSYLLAPWADALYAADDRWWDRHPQTKEFAGLKIAPESSTAKRLGLQIIALRNGGDSDEDRIDIQPFGILSRGGNSGFQAVNLVTQFGCRRQIWLGFDFDGDHWHGKHPTPLANPRPQTLEKWRRRLDAQSEVLAGLGVEVINVSEESKLTAYRKMSIDDAFAHWGI